MKKLFAILLLLPAFAAPVSAAEEHVRLDAAPIDPRDLISLQAGARTFVNYCINCHSASLMRYTKLKELGLSEQQIKDNLLFTSDKLSDVMSVAMPAKDAKAWLGTPPPDLSVIARARGADWLYTYMRGFYRDPQAATGWNNMVYDRVAMPHVLWNLSGQNVLVEQRFKTSAQAEAVGRQQKYPWKVEELPGAAKGGEGAYVLRAMKQETPGVLSPIEYDTTVRDLVNYMVWMSEPNQVTRKQVGIVVLLLLSILLGLAYALYKSFWKDVH
jgi:ubiquinol-cytochrome c reductase cytochrome c1 subunit